MPVQCRAAPLSSVGQRTVRPASCARLIARRPCRCSPCRRGRRSPSRPALPPSCTLPTERVWRISKVPLERGATDRRFSPTYIRQEKRVRKPAWMRQILSGAERAYSRFLQPTTLERDPPSNKCHRRYQQTLAVPADTAAVVKRTHTERLADIAADRRLDRFSPGIVRFPWPLSSGSYRYRDTEGSRAYATPFSLALFRAEGTAVQQVRVSSSSGRARSLFSEQNVPTHFAYGPRGGSPLSARTMSPLHP